MSDPWSPSSWRQKHALQQPRYDDPAELESVMDRLAQLPPLVTSWEIESLKEQLALAGQGEAFLLQGGDCSEVLDDCSTEAVVRQLKVLMQMSFVMMFGARKRIIRVGRIAGQYAKPRSADTETRDGVTLPVYRGDIVNRNGFSESERRADPQLLLRGYERAALTLNFIRALSVGGFADLHHPENWDLEFVRDSDQSRHFHRMVDSITDSLQFMETVKGISIAETKTVEFFTSHEGLHLAYEQAQTRQVPRRPGFYNLSTHFPWIGFRTQQIDGAHIEYFRGIANPVGLKVGPGTDTDKLQKLIDLLNPSNELGRLTLIHRFGRDQIESLLPPILRKIQHSGANVVWCCDPMHGNTHATDQGTKTRPFEKIAGELALAFDLHRAEGTILGGVHLELTGDNVTECTGGVAGLTEDDLHRAYKSAVDPRLNYEQAMELAFLIANKISGEH